MGLLLPKFLTKEIAEEAVDIVLETVMRKSSRLRNKVKRFHGHIIVVVPARDVTEDHCTHKILFERSIGDKSEWEHEYEQIAGSKAVQLWNDRNDDRAAVIPHLLLEGETPYWGGVKRDGIVVAFSGVQSWFDKMISAIALDIMVALAHNAYEEYRQNYPNSDFVV